MHKVAQYDKILETVQFGGLYMATIKDIAQRCKVSTSTVSRALKNSDSISKETKDLIKKAAEELDFRPRSYKSSAQIVKNGNKIVALLLNVKHQPVEYNKIIIVHDRILSKRDV